MAKIEEKAKAYNGNYKAFTELINRLEDVKEAIKKQNYGIAMDILYKPYPEFQITTSTELKESEDERIRENIIATIHLYYGEPLEDEAKEMIAWLERRGQTFTKKDVDDAYLKGVCDAKHELEKQGKNNMGISEATKQKLEDNLNKALEKETPESWNEFLDDKVEPKFKVGDWVVIDGEVLHIKEVTEDGYFTDEGWLIPFRNEKEAHIWTIQDAKDGDLIYVSTEEKGIQAIFHEYKNETIFFHCYLCNDFVQGSYIPIGSVELVYPLQKVHYKRFFEKMHEAGYEWDAEKKELKKKSTEEYNITGIGSKNAQGKLGEMIKNLKSAWSEEDVEIVETLNEYVKNLDTLFSEIKIGDKDILSKEFREKVQLWLNSLKNRVQPKQWWSEEDCNQIETIACHLDNIGNGAMAELLLNIMDKYKSLRHQTTWKPSDEQMTALRRIKAAIAGEGDIYKPLNSLYEDLKKLMEV